MPRDSGDEAPGGIPHSATAAELRDVLAAERAPTPFLLYRDGEGVLRVRALTRARLTLGRGAANDIALPWDEEVSRAHAEIERVGDDWVLGDDGLSLNGTHVNGERLRGRHRLEDSDHILLGRTAIVFRRAGAVSEGSTVAGPVPAAATAITPAQRRVLVALCRPLVSPGVVTAATNQEIAEALHLSVEAVKAHLRALFHSFGVGGLPQNAKRAALADRALRTGAVTPRDLE